MLSDGRIVRPAPPENLLPPLLERSAAPLQADVSVRLSSRSFPRLLVILFLPLVLLLLFSILQEEQEKGSGPPARQGGRPRGFQGPSGRVD